MSLRPPHPDYYDLAPSAVRIDRSAVMAFAWRRVRRERAVHVRAGIPCPPVQVLLAQELREAWGWAKAVRQGRAWGTLFEPGKSIHQRGDVAMSETEHTLENYPYRSGVLYASARAVSAAVTRAIASINRGDPTVAVDTLRHALDLIEPQLNEIDRVNQARLQQLSTKPHVTDQI